MKKLFMNPDFELIRIGLVADATTTSQTNEENVPVDGVITPTEPDGGDFGEWE